MSCRFRPATRCRRPACPIARASLPEPLLLQNVVWFCRVRWIVVALLALFGLMGLFPQFERALGLQAPPPLAPRHVGGPGAGELRFPGPRPVAGQVRIADRRAGEPLDADHRGLDGPDGRRPLCGQPGDLHRFRLSLPHRARLHLLLAPGIVRRGGHGLRVLPRLRGPGGHRRASPRRPLRRPFAARADRAHARRGPVERGVGARGLAGRLALRLAPLDHGPRARQPAGRDEPPARGSAAGEEPPHAPHRARVEGPVCGHPRQRAPAPPRALRAASRRRRSTRSTGSPGAAAGWRPKSRRCSSWRTSRPPRR